MLKVEQTMT